MVKFTIAQYDLFMDEKRRNDNVYFDQTELRVFNAIKRKIDMGTPITLFDYELAFLLMLIDFINRRVLRLDDYLGAPYTLTEYEYFKMSERFMRYYNKDKSGNFVYLWLQHKTKLIATNMNV